MAGTTLGLEKAVGTKSLLETAPGWKQPLAGNSPWLETAPGWKQPLAGNSPWLETAPGWIISSKSLHALDMPQDYFCSCRSFAKLSGKLPKVFNTTSDPCRKSNIFLLPFFQTFLLSLGRVVPAPHTQHLLGPFAAIAQNSLLRSFSIVDSLGNRQHSCRGSEELAIRKTARFRATPSSYQHSELLRVGGAQELRAIPSYFEPLRAATRGFRALRAATQSY